MTRMFNTHNGCFVLEVTIALFDRPRDGVDAFQ